MDYFQDAFGGFDPRYDNDAALKFCLDSLVADGRMKELRSLVSRDQRLGGVEGEPGWIIECRQDGEVVSYESWPTLACYRAYVDPMGYSLANPEFFSDRATFYRYVAAIIGAYKRRYPNYEDVIDDIEGIISDSRGGQPG